MKPRRVLLLIAGGVLAWGLFHAYGAYRYNHSWPRFWVVMGSVAAFLAFWGTMLAARRSRLKRQGPRRLGPRDAC